LRGRSISSRLLARTSALVLGSSSFQSSAKMQAITKTTTTTKGKKIAPFDSRTTSHFLENKFSGCFFSRFFNF
jgi:hypothetical protein